MKYCHFSGDILCQNDGIFSCPSGFLAGKEVADWLAEKGYDPHYGARPIKRDIQRYILNSLSRDIVAGTISKGDLVRVQLQNGKLVFKTSKKE